MKKALLSIIAFTVSATFCLGQSSLSGVNTNTTNVDGYTKSDGTIVQPYTRTQSNTTNHDNYSTSPNTNPYTGSTGTKAPDYSSQSQSIQSNHDVQTGSRGGQYYINSNGNKTYVPKSR